MPLSNPPIQDPITIGSPRLNQTWVKWFTLLNSFVNGTAVGSGVIVIGGNADKGISTLVGGTIVVPCTIVGATSNIQLTGRGGNVTNLGTLYVSSITNGVSFTVQSTNVMDAQDFSWLVV